jgi:hypothetical protein
MIKPKPTIDTRRGTFGEYETEPVLRDDGWHRRYVLGDNTVVTELHASDWALSIWGTR